MEMPPKKQERKKALKMEMPPKKLDRGKSPQERIKNTHKERIKKDPIRDLFFNGLSVGLLGINPSSSFQTASLTLAVRYANACERTFDGFQFRLTFKRRLSRQSCFQEGSLLYAEKVSPRHFFFTQPSH